MELGKAEGQSGRPKQLSRKVSVDQALLGNSVGKGKLTAVGGRMVHLGEARHPRINPNSQKTQHGGPRNTRHMTCGQGGSSVVYRETTKKERESINEKVEDRQHRRKKQRVLSLLRARVEEPMGGGRNK